MNEISLAHENEERTKAAKEHINGVNILGADVLSSNDSQGPFGVQRKVNIFILVYLPKTSFSKLVVRATGSFLIFFSSWPSV